MKILFLVPYPIHESPSQRFRFEQYFKALEETGFDWRAHSFLTPKNWSSLYSKGGTFRKALDVMVNLIKRVWIVVVKVPFFDFIFIHREATPLGPPVLEWIIAKVLRKKIIYDFDDAIWLTDRLDEPWILRFIKCRWKVRKICRWAYRVSCGNEFLRAYALQFNSNAFYIPTTIDTQHWHNPSLYNKMTNPNKVVIGWTGSHSTLKYLREIEPVLREIETSYPQVEILVIANQEPDLQLNSIRFVHWNKETEVADLMPIDIGIMPLPNDPWSKGKCGFKALQYMALEIPCIISPVGVNTMIVDHGKNGFLASTPDEWLNFTKQLIHDVALRKQMGKAGREKVIKGYSVDSTTPSFLALFR